MLIRCYGVKLLSVSVFLPQLAGRWLDDSDDKVQAEFKKCVYNGESELERGGPFQFQNLEGGSQAPTEWIRSCRRGNRAIGTIWHLKLALKACGNASNTDLDQMAHSIYISAQLPKYRQGFATAFHAPTTFLSTSPSQLL